MREAVAKENRDAFQLERSPRSRTGFVNVIEVKGKYQARLQVPGDGRGGCTKRKQYSLPGLFDTPEEAAVLLAAAANGIGEHCRAAQIRSQHCIPPHASSTSATPAMPSTMLDHVDIQFVTPLIGAPEGDVWRRRRPARRRIDTGPSSVGGPVHGLERTTKREPWPSHTDP